MKGLSRESRLLIDAAREGDDPSTVDRKRVRAALARKLAVGAAAGAIAATATHAAAGGVAAGTSGAAAGSAVTGLGVGAGAGTAAGAGAASVAAGAFASGIGMKLLVSVAIVGAMSAGAVGYAHREEAKRSESRVVTVERVVAPGALAPKGAAVAPSRTGAVPPPVVAKADPRSPPAIVPEVISARPAPLTKPLTPSLPPTAVAAPSTASDLDIELALLQDAHGALQMNDGARALRLLDEHARRFPDGALAEESEAARVFALRQVGRTDEARDVAARFLREHPRSPLAPRVNRAFDAEPPTF